MEPTGSLPGRAHRPPPPAGPARASTAAGRAQQAEPDQPGRRGNDAIQPTPAPAQPAP
jgi:hypothetical protein